MRSRILSVVAEIVYSAAPTRSKAVPPWNRLRQPGEPLAQLRQQPEQSRGSRNAEQRPPLQVELEDGVHSADVAAHHEDLDHDGDHQRRARQEEDKALCVGQSRPQQSGRRPTPPGARPPNQSPPPDTPDRAAPRKRPQWPPRSTAGTDAACSAKKPAWRPAIGASPMPASP